MSNVDNVRIRRGLSSRQLPCGCVAGVYETYRDEIVTIIDVRGNGCGNAAHTSGNIVPAPRSARDPRASESPRD